MATKSKKLKCRNTPHRLPMTCSASSLAKQITKEIMTMDKGTHAAVTVERIAFMKKQPDGSERNLGGYADFVVEREILKCLTAAGL